MKCFVEHRYSAILETCGNLEMKGFFTFGLLVESILPNRWERIQVLHDVSSDMDLTVHMADMFNAHQLHPVHFVDAVEDMLP